MRRLGQSLLKERMMKVMSIRMLWWWCCSANGLIGVNLGLRVCS
jgi:hypothetical protein